jgi:hypothetical protein
MARHHRNLDEWEAERGITMGHIHPPVQHNTAEAGSLAKLSSPRLLAAQQSLQVIDKNLGLPRPTEPAIQVLRVTLRVGRTMPRRRRAHSLPPDL